MLLAATPDPAPWWGAPLIAAIALLIGSGLTLLVTWLRGQHEQRLTDRRRWDDLILDTAVQIEAICGEIAGIGRYGWPKYIADANARTERYVELVDQLNVAQAKYRLVASEPLREVTTALFVTALKEFIGRGEDAVKSFEDARMAFNDEVRRELRAN